MSRLHEQPVIIWIPEDRREEFERLLVPDSEFLVVTDLPSDMEFDGRLVLVYHESREWTDSAVSQIREQAGGLSIRLVLLVEVSNIDSLDRDCFGVDDVWTWPLPPVLLQVKIASAIGLLERLEDQDRQYQFLTKQKQLFLRQKSKLENTIKGLPFGIILADPEGRISVINKRAKQIIGLDLFDDVQTAGFLREKIGYYPFDLVRGMADNDGVIMEETLRLDSGTFKTKIINVRDYAKTVIGTLIIFQDAQEGSHFRSQAVDLINSVLHEIRTPITSIVTSLDLLHMQLADSLPERMLRILEISMKNCQRLIQLSTDFLDISRIESGFIDMDHELFSLSTLLGETVEAFYSSALEKQIQLQTHLTHGTDMIEADPSRLRQVFNNLISNAIKFSDEGGTVSISAHDDNDDPQHPVIITVHNMGRPIPLQDQDKIFERFFRSEHSVHHNRIGSGLGLYITKIIITAFGGTISVISEDQKGTAFCIRLPVRRDDGISPSSIQ